MSGEDLAFQAVAVLALCVYFYVWARRRGEPPRTGLRYALFILMAGIVGIVGSAVIRNAFG